MLRRALLLPALVGLVKSQTITSSAPYSPVATPDALPTEDLRDVDVPTYTEHPGLDSDIVFYATATAIAAVKADVTADPLSVFPAVTTVPINAAGEDSDNNKRGLAARSACDAQATIANYYSVKVDSYSAFKADPTISSVALAAPTPAGYFNNFKNAPGANSAYAYLGYAVVNKGNTGYDVNWCANKCNGIAGCLSFNIFFERDPVQEPGTGCTNPAAFSNIKCTFWGSALDSSTANNFGQWRANFQVGIAGSNAYTSYKVGGPVTGYNAAVALNTSTLNAPLRDCSNTWTYLGYKLLRSGPYDTTLCAAACDAQTAYNAANPPANGKPVRCAAFGSYILSMTNKTSTYQLGQMCTMYTSDWSKQYAVNTVSYDDGIGAKYTYSYSFLYAKPDIQPICTADIDYLNVSGADFCTSFNSYSAPTTTVTATSTPSLVVDSVTTTVSTFLAGVTATVTTNIQWKRQDSTTDSATADSGPVLDGLDSYTTVQNVPALSAATLATYIATVTAVNGTVPTDLPANNIVADESTSPNKERRDLLLPRAIATPASIASWPTSRIHEACSMVATGTQTNTATSTLATPHSTTTINVVASQTTTLSACAVPTQLAEYRDFVPIYGNWVDGTVGNDGNGYYNQEKTLQLPFAMNIGSVSSDIITVGTNGYVKVGSSGQAQLVAFAGEGSGLYVYGGSNGVFYRITGTPGSRQLVVAWYVGTYAYGHQQNHFTITYFEGSNVVQYKYYDVVQQPSYQASAYAAINGVYTSIVNAGSGFAAGDQLQLTFSGNSAQATKTRHDRVDCCGKRTDNWFGMWHSCTEYQPARLS